LPTNTLSYIDMTMDLNDISNAPLDFDDSIDNYGSPNKVGDSGFLDNIINNKIKEKMNQIKTAKTNDISQ
jgi:hypothetical protein